MPRGRYQQKQWAMRQHAILEALAERSRTHGFANVTMDDLADTVGISKATLYQHFNSKDELLVALIHQHTEQFIAWLATTADQPPITRLRETVRYLIEGHITPLRGLMQVGHEDVMPVFENSEELVAQHAQTLAMLSAIIEQGQSAGTIARDIAPQVIVRTMWALGTMPLEPRPNDPAHTAQLDRAAHSEQILTLFERSIRPANTP